MNYLLACRVNGETLYLADPPKSGVLTRHKAGAAVFLSRANAEEAAEKYRKPRGRVDKSRPRLYLSPLREGGE